MGCVQSNWMPSKDKSVRFAGTGGCCGQCVNNAKGWSVLTRCVFRRPDWTGFIVGARPNGLWHTIQPASDGAFSTVGMRRHAESAVVLYGRFIALGLTRAAVVRAGTPAAPHAANVGFRIRVQQCLIVMPAFGFVAQYCKGFVDQRRRLVIAATIRVPVQFSHQSTVAGFDDFRGGVRLYV